MLAGAETGGAFGPVEIAEWPGAAPSRDIRHGFDEMTNVVDGDLTFELARVTPFVPVDNLVYVSKGAEHGFVDTS